MLLQRLSPACVPSEKELLGAREPVVPQKNLGSLEGARNTGQEAVCVLDRLNGLGKACFAANSLRLAALRRVPLSERSKLLLNSQQLTKYLFSGT